MESKKLSVTHQNAMNSLEPGLPLKMQNQQNLMLEVCKLLDRLAVIYQIPNYDMKVNSMLLAEWIMDNYKYEDYGLVVESLRNPVRLNDHTWRLTPDSISGWIEHTRIKRAEKAQAEESKKRQEMEISKSDISPETQKLIQETLNKLLDGPKNVMTLSPDEIKEEGQTRPKAFKHPSTDAGYVKEWTERVKRHAEMTYRERHPNATDEEVNRFLKTI